MCDAEIAHYIGQTFGANFWDIHKFFDTVDPIILAESASELNYPPSELRLGLQMHLAPRVLQMNGSCSSGTAVDTSILAGCSQSVPFTRAYLKKPVASTVRIAPETITEVYIDDVSQTARGSKLLVISRLVAGGLSLADGARSLRCIAEAALLSLQNVACPKNIV